MTRTSTEGVSAIKKREHHLTGRQPFYKSYDFWRSFLGAFSYLETFDPFYYKRNPWRADYEALRGDWEAVGLDFTKAMKQFELEHADKLEEARQQQRLFDPDKSA
jgi:hypothetical protein